MDLKVWGEGRTSRWQKSWHQDLTMLFLLVKLKRGGSGIDYGFLLEFRIFGVAVFDLGFETCIDGPVMFNCTLLLCFYSAEFMVHWISKLFDQIMFFSFLRAKFWI